MEAGTRMGATHCALAATTGAVTLPVHTRPCVTLLTSGDEIVPIPEVPEPHQLRNGNGTMASVLAERMGGEDNYPPPLTYIAMGVGF